jgi:hypothetical protein
MIHRFSAEGEHLGGFGGEGEGPGEFGRLTWAIAIPDQVLAWDSSLFRVSRFDITGRLIDQSSLDNQDGRLSRVSRIIPLGAGSRSRSIGIAAFGQTDSPNPPEAFYESHFHVYLFDDGFIVERALIDTVLSYETGVLGDDLRRYIQGPPIFGRASVLSAAAPDQPFAWSWNADFTIEFLDPASDDRWSVTVERELAPVTRELREPEIERWRDRGLEEQARRYLVFADRLPPLSSIMWDAAGRLWARNNQTAVEEPVSASYEVFSSDGRWLFHQTLPERALLITENGFFTGAEAPDGSPLIRFHEFRR